MPVERLETVEGVARPIGPFVHAVKSANLVFISGQVGRGPSGEVVGKGDPVTQFEQALENVRAILESVGGTFADVAMLRVYLCDMSYRERMGAVRRRVFGDLLPASTMVEVSALADPEMLVEVEVIAAL